MVEIIEHIGERIKKRREELGMSQDELAERMGYKSRSTIAKIEKGVNDVVHSNVLKFAKALNVSVSSLTGFNEIIEEKPVETAKLHARILTDQQLMETIEEYFLLSEENQKMIRDLVRNLQKKEV